MNQINDSQMAATKDVVAIVHERLEELGAQQSLEPLKQLFWTDLSYNRENRPLSYRNWSEALQKNLNEPPLLFASAGKERDFAVIYLHLQDKELFLSHERPIVQKLLDEHLDALFIFSNAIQSKGSWTH